MPAIDTAISALEKQISIEEVINQLRENKINCKNSSTIYDTKDYVLLDKAKKMIMIMKMIMIVKTKMIMKMKMIMKNNIQRLVGSILIANK